MVRARSIRNFLRARKTALFVCALALCACGCLAYIFWTRAARIEVALVDAQEDIMMTLFPSPERAFAYGELHFDATDPSEYDIDRAQYFFDYAAARDPQLPYLYHELARISFLQGNFFEAFTQINFQIGLHGDSEPAAYYVRGLIEGYMGQYSAAATDYAHFLQFDPTNWAAENDEAWVLLKANRYQAALQVTQSGLQRFPDNPWLLNSEATALYQLGDDDQALAAVERAAADVQTVTPQDWETAYPGNDPAIAAAGLASFQAAIAGNMHTIELAVASGTVQSK